MNEPVRIVADWLNNTTTGATSVAEVLALSDFPKDTADALPSNPTLYDSTRDGWAARGVFPRDGSVTYPCVVTSWAGFRDEAPAETQSAGSLLNRSECTVVVMIAHRLQDSDEGVEDVGYLHRAVRGSLTLLNAQGNGAARTRNGFQLTQCTAITTTPIRAEDDDKLIGVQLSLTYTTHETTP